jgi:hypothetical protein
MDLIDIKIGLKTVKELLEKENIEKLNHIISKMNSQELLRLRRLEFFQDITYNWQINL